MGTPLGELDRARLRAIAASDRPLAPAGPATVRRGADAAPGGHDRRPRCLMSDRPGLRVSQGSRFSNALPLSASRGTETWSCTMSQLPSIFWKHAVHRAQ